MKHLPRRNVYIFVEFCYLFELNFIFAKALCIFLNFKKGRTASNKITKKKLNPISSSMKNAQF